eukprot:Sdes_comp9203_c0_seq1m682
MPEKVHISDFGHQFEEIPLAEVKKHNSLNDAWVIVDGYVYNVTKFLPLHPGGADIMSEYLGEDCSDILRDFDFHVHSKAAFQMLAPYLVGPLQSAKFRIPHGPSQFSLDVDWSKGLLLQVGSLTSIYSDWVDRPVNAQPRLFNHWFPEMLSKTPWYFVALLFIPFVVYQGALALLLGPARLHLSQFTLLVLFGVFLWTFTEYLIHRFAFHSAPPSSSRLLITLHFLFHGIHHKCPTDQYRLVMPPIISIPFAICFLNSTLLLLPSNIAHAITCGFAGGYTYYDLFHFHSHHTNFSNRFISDMKHYHMAHHFRNPDAGFGVSSKLWDWVFNTAL